MSKEDQDKILSLSLSIGLSKKTSHIIKRGVF